VCTRSETRLVPVASHPQVDSETDRADDVVVLSDEDIAGLLVHEDYRDAIHRAFRATADTVAGPYRAMTVNGRALEAVWPRSLPVANRVIVLADRCDGRPVALVAVDEIAARCGATLGLLAAEWFARPSAATLLVVGCTRESRAQARALLESLEIVRGYAWDPDPLCARDWAGDLSLDTRIDIRPVDTVGEIAPSSDIVIAATRGVRPPLTPDVLAHGCLILAIGVDRAVERGIDPSVLAVSTVIHDLAEIVAGCRSGRLSRYDTIVLESDGVAPTARVAVAAYARAQVVGAGQRVPFRRR
jgi:ornithine cyclodeaminase/alanine dehydrogenase-like protein (mu-crystallin family)